MIFISKMAKGRPPVVGKEADQNGDHTAADAEDQLAFIGHRGGDIVGSHKEGARNRPPPGW